MREMQSLVASSLANAVGELYREYGFWRVVRALTAAVWRKEWGSNRVVDLDNYMRRDIGLPEIDVPRRRAGLNPWDIKP